MDVFFSAKNCKCSNAVRPNAARLQAFSIDALLCLLALFAESLMNAILRTEKRPYNSLAVDWRYTLCKLSMNCNAVCIIYFTEVKEIASNIYY